MEKKNARHLITVLLCVVVFLISVGFQPNIGYVECRPYDGNANDLPPLLTLGSPTSSQIVNFNVTGENYKGERISMTQEGGTIEITGSEIYFIPWKHLFWSEKKMDVFFLANVTSTNFHIAFLCVTDQSTSFEVKMFEYSSATYQKISYKGRGIVTTTPSPTQNPLTQALSIAPQPRTENKLFATGPDLYLVGDQGHIKEKSTLLDLYALRNTISTRLEWNELWALLVGTSGDYYFSIIYMNTEDRSKVLLGHALRLNDYYVPEQRQLAASWSTKGEAYHLFINAPQDVGAIWVDGFRFQRRDDSTFKVTVTKGNHTLAAENGTAEKNGVRLGFSHWSDGDDANPRNVRIRSNMTFTAEYSREFLLAVESAYKAVTGGWYREGQIVPVPQPPSVEQDEVKYYFDSWSGDVRSDNNSTFVVMDSPKTIRANWGILYSVTLSASGLPDGTEVVYKMNDRELRSVTPDSVQEWVKENSLLYLSADLPGSQAIKEQLFLQGWKDQRGKEIKSPIQVAGPERLVALFNNQKQSTKLSCRVSTADLLTTGQLRIEGEITPPFQTKVIIEYRASGEPWTILTDVETASTGQYRYDWQPAVSGILQIRSTYPGDASHTASSSETQSVAVSQSMVKFKRLAGAFSNSTSSFYEELEGPQNLEGSLKALFSLGMVAVDQIYTRLANLKPLGPIAAIVVGSALIGLFYVFPWVTIVMVLAAIITKRAISRRVLLPLVAVWAASFSYLVLEELNATGLLEPSSYLLTVFTSSLAATTGLMAGLIPSTGISNSLVGRWRLRNASVASKNPQTQPLND